MTYHHTPYSKQPFKIVHGVNCVMFVCCKQGFVLYSLNVCKENIHAYCALWLHKLTDAPYAQLAYQNGILSSGPLAGPAKGTFLNNDVIKWKHLMTSSNGNIFRVTGPLWGNSPATGEFPSQRQVTPSFDVFFDLCLYKRLSKQFWGWWFETASRSLWRQCNGDGISSSHLKNPGRRYERNIEKSALSLY